MTAQLRVVAENPSVVRGKHFSSKDLFWLADRLTELVSVGNPLEAHLLASRAHLNPLNISVLATRMSRSGLSEDQILQVVV